MVLIVDFICNRNISSSETSEPSWSEVRNFVKFLNAQLSDCEKSPYCSVDDLHGFKGFVVKFAILMAKVIYFIDY